jgi:hypothetical protein
MPDPLDPLGFVDERELTHAVYFGSTDARRAMRRFSTQHAMRQRPTAILHLDLDLLPPDPIDYLAPLAVVAQHESFTRPLFVGVVTEAIPKADEIEISAYGASELAETTTPAFASSRVPVFEILHFLARTAGMREEQLKIDGFDTLPTELFEVVTPLEGVAVGERLRVGPISIVPQGSVLVGSSAPETYPSIESLHASVCAVAVVRAQRMLDAEEMGLRDIETTLSWLIVRARNGTALLPDGSLQAFSRREALCLPRRSGDVFVRGLSTQRSWIHGSDRGDAGGKLTLDKTHRFLDIDPAVERFSEKTRQAILALGRATREAEPLARMGALWDAIEFYVGNHEPAKLFASADKKKIKKALPPDLSEGQRARITKLIDEQLNSAPLRARLYEVLERESVSYSDAEVDTLFVLRKLRNDAVHGEGRSIPTEEQLQQATALVSRMLVNRAWAAQAHLRS